MPKQVILNMQNTYPFGQCKDCDNSHTKVLVRRTLNFHKYTRQYLNQRIYFFRRLNHQSIISIQNILEEEESLNILYEYIPIKMAEWIGNINQKFLDNFCQEMIAFGNYLSKVFINIELKFRNIGMDENYNAKYYLDLHFQIDHSLQKQDLKSKYHQQIVKMFEPYFNTINAPNNHSAIKTEHSEHMRQKGKSTRNASTRYQNFLVQVDQRNKKKQQKNQNKISKNSLLERAQRVLAKNKERKVESINYPQDYELVRSSKNIACYDKTRKQSILSSVSNVKINRLGRKIEQIKSRIGNLHIPLYEKQEKKSIERKDNIMAFNYDSTERILHKFSPHTSQKIQSNLIRNLKKQESLLNKFPFQEELLKGLNLKKNQELKQKEYEQMKRSDDTYIKDFFEVLEERPKSKNGTRMLEYESNEKPIPEEEMQPILTARKKDSESKNQTQELQSRVKSAINKSKNLISRFKHQ